MQQWDKLRKAIQFSMGKCQFLCGLFNCWLQGLEVYVYSIIAVSEGTAFLNVKLNNAKPSVLDCLICCLVYAFCLLFQKV
jgi:hypothetical protein